MNNPRRSTVPPAKPDVYWIERIRGGQRGTFTVYSPQFWGFDTHYQGGRTGFCYENPEHCDGGHNEATLRWNGYLFTWSHHLNKRCFVVFTEGAARMLLDQVAEGKTLRGLTIQMSRTKADKGRLLCHVDKFTSGQRDDLPPDCDPLKSLYNFMGAPRSDGVLRRSLAGEMFGPKLASESA